MTVSAFLQQARDRLTPHSETAYLDAQVILAHVLGQPRPWLAAHSEETIAPAQVDAAEQLLARLEAGEPLPYLIGHWEFYGLDFTLTPDVLIPRPETELLVECALAWLQAHPNRRRIADIGTGSGCIAVTLAARLPGVRVLATDLSARALFVAAGNAGLHGVSERITFAQSDLLPEGSGPFDLVCANLPYIPCKTLRGLPVSRYEPSLALDGGEDGLEVIRRLLRIAPGCLDPGGALLVEIEAGQGKKTAELAKASFPAGQVAVIPDLAGRDRLVVVQNEGG